MALLDKLCWLVSSVEVTKVKTNHFSAFCLRNWWHCWCGWCYN